MFDSAVNDMGTVYTAADCLNTAINLGNHTAADDAVTLEHRNFADIDNGVDNPGICLPCDVRSFRR